MSKEIDVTFFNLTIVTRVRQVKYTFKSKANDGDFFYLHDFSLPIQKEILIS